MLEQFEPLMTVSEVCSVLMVGKNTVYDIIKSGKVGCFRTGRTWKIKRDDLAKFIKEQTGLSTSD